MNNDYRLQLLSHSEIFPTREEALEYIDDNFKGVALWGEPALFFYGTERSPKMILAVGASHESRRPRVCLIDDEELRELIQEVKDATEQNTEDIAKAAERILNIVNAVGLTLDENRIKDQIYYEPDRTDELINQATTVAEAIAIISTFVQSKFKENELTVNDSNSIDFTFEKTENGSNLTAEVKISEEGNDDDLDFNNNIVGIKSDGLFASCNIEYDAERNRLIFTTSGVKNGRFVTDANKKIIDFGAHTIYVADNEDHNVAVTINQERGTISADVKIASDETNILKDHDGKLFVDGRAKNIKYKNTTVGAYLTTVGEEIERIKDTIQILTIEDLIEGDESDSILTKAIKNQNGGYTISSDVRLSSDESIQIGNGGIKANIDIEVDSVNNRLILKVGNTQKTVNLPGVSILDNIYYDSANKCIVITWKDGTQQTVIPVADMLKTRVVVNNPTSAVVLTKSEPSTSGQPDTLSGDVKLAPTDNLIGKDSNGQLYVRASEIDNKINAEKTAREQADNQINAAITAEADERASADSEIRGLVQTEADTRHAEDDNLKDMINAAREEASNALDAKATEIYARIDSDEDRIDQAFADAAEAKSLVELTNANLDSEVERARTAEGVNAAAIDAEKTRAIDAEGELSTRLGTVESSLATETNARTTADAVHDEQISNIQGALTSIEESHQQDIERLSGEIADNASAINILNGSETTSGSVRETVKQAKDDLNLAINNEKTRAEGKENELAGLIDAEKTRAMTAEGSILPSAKEYTDNAVATSKHLSDDYTDAAKREAIQTSKDYTDSKILEIGTSSTAYTDEKVNDEKERAMAAEGANASAIIDLQAKDLQLEGEIANKIESVTIVKNSQSDLQYILKVDGVDAGEINIPKDQFLQDVTYNAVSKELTFVFETSSGTETTVINIADLVDTYVAGNGLVLNGNVFSVKINPASEFVTVDGDGVKVSGISDALNTKADADDVYNKTEIDDKFDEIVIPDVSGFATKTEVNESVTVLQGKDTEIEAKADANTDAITIINGNEAQEGSIKKALKDAKGYTDEKVNDEKERAMAAEGANASAITIINGNEAQEGSIKKALKDAKDYTDDKVLAEKTAREQADIEINASLDNKANKSEVYTKAEIEGKNYLTQTDIAGLATKEELETEATRAIGVESTLTTNLNTANDNISANARDIDALQAEAVRLNLIVYETNSVKLIKSKDDSGTELSADVKLDVSNTNIIKISGNGLYADVEMSYSQATNTITFNNGLTTQNFQLAGPSLVEDGYYDSTTKQIVLITRLTDGTTREIRINADALIHTLKVENDTNNPIKLFKNVDEEGVDVLSARLDISTESHNLILNNNGTLYASNEAKNHTALWNGTEKSLQEVLELLKVAAEEGSEAAHEVAEIRAELNQVEGDITRIEGTLSTLSNRVDTLSNRVDSFDTRITNNTNNITTINNKLGDISEEHPVSESLNDLNGQISIINQKLGDVSVENPVSDRLGTLDGQVETMNNQLGDISGEKTVSERLEYLEQEVFNSDYGTY